MKLRGRPLIVLFTAASAVATPGVASAEPYDWQPPEVTFVAGNDSLTAIIHNPNDRGYCYAGIGVDGSVHIFGEDHDAAWPAGGETFEVTHEGLAPGVYNVHSFCALSETEAYERSEPRFDDVRVGPAPAEPTFWDVIGRSFGS